MSDLLAGPVLGGLMVALMLGPLAALGVYLAHRRFGFQQTTLAAAWNYGILGLWSWAPWVGAYARSSGQKWVVLLPALWGVGLTIFRFRICTDKAKRPTVVQMLISLFVYATIVWIIGTD